MCSPSASQVRSLTRRRYCATHHREQCEKAARGKHLPNAEGRGQTRDQNHENQLESSTGSIHNAWFRGLIEHNISVWRNFGSQV